MSLHCFRSFAILADFQSDAQATDTSKARRDEQKVDFQGCERFSDRDFLVIPGEKADVHFGGSYLFLFPRALYFSQGKPKATVGSAGNRRLRGRLTFRER